MFSFVDGREMIVSEENGQLPVLQGRAQLVKAVVGQLRSGLLEELLSRDGMTHLSKIDALVSFHLYSLT